MRISIYKVKIKKKPVVISDSWSPKRYKNEYLVIIGDIAYWMTSKTVTLIDYVNTLDLKHMILKRLDSVPELEHNIEVCKRFQVKQGLIPKDIPKFGRYKFRR